MANLPTPGADDGNWGTILNEYLEVEHNADGTHKTEYLPLAGGTLTGDVDADDNVVSQAEIKDYSETVVTANSGAAYAVNLANGNVYSLTLTDNCTITLTNPPTTGKSGSVTIFLTQDGTGGRVVIWPNTVKWSLGVEPTLSTAAASIDVVELVTIDGGTSWFGFLVGQGMN